MRHTFAAHLAEKGMPLVHIQDLLGHDTIGVTKVYARLYEEARKAKYDYYL
ncbi:tyrosine-type recombinase/integrase [Salsuginibacillus halophilus]